MRDAPSVAVVIGVAAGSRFERPESGIAHFAEHMFFKGTERRPPRATSPARSTGSAASSTPSRARSSPPTTSSARAELGAGRARRARRHADRLPLRRRGDGAREGRHRRGDQHVPRHAARPHRAGLGRGALRRHAARAPTSSAKETVRAATRETFLGYLADWYRPSAWSSGSAARSTTRCRGRATRFGDLEPCPRPAARRPCCRRRGPLCAGAQASRTRPTSCSGPAGSRSTTPTATS